KAHVNLIAQVVPKVHFFRTLPTLPRPAPFPYTTLFRSSSSPARRSPCRTLVRTATGCCPTTAPTSSSCHAAATDWSARPSSRWLDRKSTRLNSSHDQISYAVFCLKKKIKPDTVHSLP